MATAKLHAFSELVQYIHRHTDGEAEFSDWYAGLSEEPEERMEKGHNVPEGADSLWYSLHTEGAARSVEDELLSLGLDGADGGGDDDASYVYIYRKTQETDP